jgi:hypothetical protein
MMLLDVGELDHPTIIERPNIPARLARQPIIYRNEQGIEPNV